MAWTAPLAALSGRSARPAAAPRPGRVSYGGAPCATLRWLHWARIRPGALSARLRGRGAPGHRRAGYPIDPQTPARIPAFVDQALPLTRPQVTAQPLIELADLVELEVDRRAWGRDQALCRAVAAVHRGR
jgi:hypothetical protein